jgi:4-amino-4-deoxy-L-arabinose transferase-like glycosyltransferase
MSPMESITWDESRRRGAVARPRWHALLLPLPLLVAAALYLPGIGQRILYQGDEARYAILARTMLETGDWQVPRIGDEVHMEKTPLFIWAIAALSLSGGKVTELTAVLPAALSGIAAVGMTMLLARRMFGLRAALLTGFILATTWGYFWLARMALADMMVTCCVVASAAAFWAAVADGGASRRLPMALFWVCAAVGLAAKGPAGLMPLLPCGAFLITEDGWSGLRKLRPLMGLVIVVVISASWVVGFAIQREASYVQTVLVGDFLLPRVRGWRHFLDLTFAVEPITVGFLPWTPLLPVAVRDGWWRADVDDGQRRKFRFLVFWALAYVVVMTLLPHHRVRHLLPTFPALAVMVGWLWDRWAAARPASLLLYGWIWAALAVAMAVTILLPLPPWPEVAVLLPPMLAQKLAGVGLLLAGALLVIAAARAGRTLAMFAAVCAPMALLLAFEAHVAVAGHNRVFDIRSLSERLAARAGALDELVTYRYHPLPIQFYSGRAITRVGDPADLATRAAGGRRFYVVAEDFAWRDLVARTPGQAWTVVDGADINGIRVLVGTPAARP